MAIRYSEPAKPVKPLLEQAKEVRKLAEGIEAKANALLAEKRSRGRPVSGKETVTLRVDSAVAEHFRSLGDDWKARMALELKKAAKL